MPAPEWFPCPQAMAVAEAIANDIKALAVAAAGDADCQDEDVRPWGCCAPLLRPCRTSLLRPPH